MVVSNESLSYSFGLSNGFAKKPMLSMTVVESRDFLIPLSESIAFHRLPFFETIAVITKAKGANLFCWNHRRGFLCLARQKHICIFRHDGNADSFLFSIAFLHCCCCGG
ncbi:hypothetical protein AAZX31_08G146400 [Glycine max]